MCPTDPAAYRGDVCGRYASSRSAADLAAHFGLDRAPDEALTPSWNVAPTDPAPIVLERDGARLLRVARWGLVPSWAKDAKGGARLINARQETVAGKPAFRAAFARRRCLVPADGYYEWQRQAGRKVPWFLSARDGSPLAMAGLYELWRLSAAEPWLLTTTVLTTSAADDTGEIHDRTPLLVPRQAWADWLDPARERPDASLLAPAVPGVLDAWQVDPGVGNVRNDGPGLARPTG